MKPKVQFDPEFGKNARRWYWPIRSIGQLMIVVALSGLMLGGMSMRSRRPVRNSLKPFRGPMNRVQGPAGQFPAGVAQPRDRFVIVARPEIDPGMVIQARPDLDAAMVIHPGTGGRLSRVAPLVGGRPQLPGQAPVPVPDQGELHDRSPYPLVIPQPKPR